MDVLGDALLSLRIEANSISAGTFSEPWGISIFRSRSEATLVHRIVDASCWLLSDKAPPTKLHSGDSVLVLRGVPYSLASSPDVPRLDFMEFWQNLGVQRLGPQTKRVAPIQYQIGGPGAQTRIVSFAYLLHDSLRNPLLSALPEIIIVRASASLAFPWLAGAMEFLAAEETGNRPGYIATATRLAELVFTSLLRAHALSETGKSANWLRGINDVRIGKVLEAIHTYPAKPWTTVTLAAVAKTSRATFSRQFTTLVGQTPGSYLIAWRMKIAAELLLEESHSISSIAEKVGYRSEPAFREAFKKSFNLAPTHYAKRYKATL